MSKDIRGQVLSLGLACCRLLRRDDLHQGWTKYIFNNKEQGVEFSCHEQIYYTHPDCIRVCVYISLKRPWYSHIQKNDIGPQSHTMYKN